MLSNARSRRGLPWDMEPVYGLEKQEMNLKLILNTIEPYIYVEGCRRSTIGTRKSGKGGFPYFITFTERYQMRLGRDGISRHYFNASGCPDPPKV